MATENRKQSGAQRDNGGRFVKGNKSGGRPSLPEEFKRIARENSVPALQMMVDIMRDEKQQSKDRIKAGEIILDRAYGKAPQHIDANFDGKLIIELDPKLKEWAE